jgi:protein-tyrosine phosphatase
MFNWFKKKITPDQSTISVPETDIHSHLLPGIDDGAESMEQTVELIRGFAELGYKRLITTPHIMGDFFRNTPEIISAKLEEVRNTLITEQIDISIDAAAEYYLDESFIARLENAEPLLTFGDRYVLFETSYMNEPVYLKDIIFLLKAANYQPVLAHPERYMYLFNNPKKLEEIAATGVHLQINMLSLSGYYSKQSQKIAERLIDAEMVSMIGSDCHKMKQQQTLIDTIGNSKYYRKVLQQSLLNHSL